MKPDFADALRNNTLLYANLLKIVNKDGQTVPFEPNPGQIAFNEILERQRSEGKPIRVIVLKARQIGFSTFVQAKMIQRCTTRENHQALVVAHNKDTAKKLFAMAQKMYVSLPKGEEFPDTARPIRPEIASTQRSEYLRFAPAERGAWMEQEMWPNSEYAVDTAKEFQAGRGATYHSVHASELAFWDQPEAKLTALKNAVPKSPESMFVIESTANGHNFFKEQWDLAVAGESEYAALFWPWYKEPSYAKPFISEAERAAFKIGDHRWGEDEPALMNRYGCSLEQLNWRRDTIANECSGRLDLFKQEYPTTPEEAFLGTGARVFDPEMVKSVLFQCEKLHDPEPPKAGEGPLRGVLRPTAEHEAPARAGTILVPDGAQWVPHTELELGHRAPWKLWLETDEIGMPKVPKGPKVIGVDVSGGQVESEGGEPAYHAIEVIDQIEGTQLAEYTSRIDPHLLAREVYLAALMFGYDPERAEGPMIAIERTGSWGLPVVRTLWFDFHYFRLYRSKAHDRTTEKQEHRLGWDTSPKTKPSLLALGQELLASDSAEIRSRMLAGEMLTYVRDEKGRTGPEPNKFADRLMAWLIARQVARETPLELQTEEDEDKAPELAYSSFRARDRVTGY